MRLKQLPLKNSEYLRKLKERAKKDDVQECLDIITKHHYFYQCNSSNKDENIINLDSTYQANACRLAKVQFVFCELKHHQTLQNTILR